MHTDCYACLPPGRPGETLHPLHPLRHQVDQRTGETLFFGYNLNNGIGEAYMHHSVISREGKLISTTPIDLPEKAPVA